MKSNFFRAVAAATLLVGQISVGQTSKGFDLNAIDQDEAASKVPQILYTGATDGVYFNNFAPPIEKLGAKNKITIINTRGLGSKGNIKAVAADRNALGLSQSDTLLSMQQEEPETFAKIRILGMITEECMFAITSPKYASVIQNIGNVVQAADEMGPRLKVASGPEGSGSRKTWETFANGGPLANVTQVNKEAADVLNDIANGTVHIGFFVRYPLTANSAYKKIYDKGLSYVSVAHPVLSNFQIGGVSVYQVKEGSDAPVIYSGKIPTTCVPVALIANANPANPKVLKTFTPASMADLKPTWDKESTLVYYQNRAVSLVKATGNLMGDVISASKEKISATAVDLLSGR